MASAPKRSGSSWTAEGLWCSSMPIAAVAAAALTDMFCCVQNRIKASRICCLDRCHESGRRRGLEPTYRLSYASLPNGRLSVGSDGGALFFALLRGSDLRL